MVQPQVVRLVEDGGGAVLEPKDLSGIKKFDEEVFIQLNCGGRGRLRSGKRLFKAEYVFDCVRRSRLLPNLSEYLCKEKEELCKQKEELCKQEEELCKQEEEHRKEGVSRDEIEEGQMEGTRDPFEVSFSLKVEKKTL